MIRTAIILICSFFVSGACYAMRHRYASDAFVRLIEAREHLTPGDARVVPDCGCTIRYVGTQIVGTQYRVIFERLD